MGNGRLGVLGNLAAKLVEEVGDLEPGAVTHLHLWEPGEIALVHPQRQANAMKKTVHHVKFIL